MFQPSTGSSSGTSEINSYKNRCTRIHRFNPHQKLMSHRYCFFLLHLPIVIGNYAQSRMVAQEFTGLTPHQKLMSHRFWFFLLQDDIGHQQSLSPSVREAPGSTRASQICGPDSLSSRKRISGPQMRFGSLQVRLG
jgi:hypothetical protein